MGETPDQRPVSDRLQEPPLSRNQPLRPVTPRPSRQRPVGWLHQRETPSTCGLRAKAKTFSAISCTNARQLCWQQPAQQLNGANQTWTARSPSRVFLMNIN